MAICRQKKGDKIYLYRYKSVREGKKVKHVFQEYLGIEDKNGNIIKTPKRTLDKINISNTRFYGAVRLLWEITQEFEFEKIIDEIAPKRGFKAGKMLTLLAINRCIDPKSLNKFSYWYDRTYLPQLTNLESKHVNKNNLLSAMDAICGIDAGDEYDLTLNIEKALFEKYKSKLPADTFSALYYDITRSIFSGNNCILAFPGYNPKIKNKKQINIGLIVTRKHHFPIFHFVFKGNMHDSLTVGKVLSIIKSFGITNVTIIWDRGMMSFDNMAWLVKHGFNLITGLKKNLVECEDIYQEWIVSESPEFFIKRFGDGAIYAIGKDRTLNDQKGKLIVYQNTMIRDAERVERNEKIKAAIIKLKEVAERNKETAEEKVNKILKGIEKYFEISYYQSNDKIKVNNKLSTDEITYSANRDGKFSIFSTDLSMPTEEVIKVYFDKNEIERTFRIMKQIMELEPTRHRLSNRVKSYVFVCYLSFLIYSILEYRIKDLKLDLSVEDVIEKLNDIEHAEVTYSNQKESRFLNIGKIQKEIINKLQIKDYFLSKDATIDLKM